MINDCNFLSYDIKINKDIVRYYNEKNIFLLEFFIYLLSITIFHDLKQDITFNDHVKATSMIYYAKLFS